MLKGFWKTWKDASFLYKIKQLGWELRYAFQRAWKGYDDIDVINFQGSFLERMINILKCYREHTWCYNTIFGSLERKHKAIDDMITAFDDMQVDVDDELDNLCKTDYCNKEILLKNYKKALTICNERKNKAFDLLKEHFDYL